MAGVLDTRERAAAIVTIIILAKQLQLHNCFYHTAED